MLDPLPNPNEENTTERSAKAGNAPSLYKVSEHRVGVHLGGMQLHVTRYTPEKITKMPLMCIAGFYRNGRDFETMAASLLTNKNFGREIVCIDLPGRGLSGHLKKATDYASHVDAACVHDAMLALNISKAMFVAQAHGGHIASLLATQHPSLVAGAVLINCGPNIDPLSLVRMRQTLNRLIAVNQYHEAERAFTLIYGEQFARADKDMKQHWVSRVIEKKSNGIGQPMLDAKLAGMLNHFDADPESLTCWALMGALKNKPVTVIRSSDTKQLDAPTFEKMQAVWPSWDFETLQEEPDCLTLESLHLHDLLEEKLKKQR